MFFKALLQGICFDLYLFKEDPRFCGGSLSLQIRMEGLENRCDYLESHGWLVLELVLETSFAAGSVALLWYETALTVLGSDPTNKWM